MVQAVVTLSECEDRVVQMVKGRYGIPTKAETVSFIISDYAEKLLEPELRPEFGKEKLRLKSKVSLRKYSSFAEFENDIRSRRKTRQGARQASEAGPRAVRRGAAQNEGSGVA